MKKMVFKRQLVEQVEIDEEFFNEICNTCNVSGVNWKTLCAIFEGSCPDQPIQIGGDSGNVESPIYAAEFFTECFNEMLDRDSNYEDTYVLDIPNFQFERIEKR